MPTTALQQLPEDAEDFWRQRTTSGTHHALSQVEYFHSAAAFGGEPLEPDRNVRRQALR